MNDVERGVVDKAVLVVIEACNLGRKIGEQYKCDRSHRLEMEALFRANLLATPLMRDALHWCKEYAKVAPNAYCYPENMVSLVGREALALEKPKERYYVYETDALGKTGWRWAVLFDQAQSPPPRFGRAVCYFDDEADARAYAASKNAEDAKGEGR